MRVPSKHIHQQFMTVLRAWGMSKAHAGTTADMMVETDLRGVDSHAISMLPTYFFLAVDPRAFREEGAFEEDLDTVIDVLHKARPADPAQPVLVAGDPEMERRKERLVAGVPIPDDLMTQLREVAKRGRPVRAGTVACA